MNVPPPNSPYSLLVHTYTVLFHIAIVLSDLVLVFLMLVQNILMNVSKNTEHNFAGLEALVCTTQLFQDPLGSCYQEFVYSQSLNTVHAYSIQRGAC